MIKFREEAVQYLLDCEQPINQYTIRWAEAQITFSHMTNVIRRAVRDEFTGPMEDSYEAFRVSVAQRELLIREQAVIDAFAHYTAMLLIVNTDGIDITKELDIAAPTAFEQAFLKENNDDGTVTDD